ncbi:hypothetical protein H072_3142 [Dactylellina haptotyla CBS 200.50]|uniref:Uncharacterized protein n=1 Tax=Dactylellina haptotyla (strain CBS 200.50) TaxID=1284197 RepID=S8AIM7_DACHA|nr:hypothetical protein H072_3142 [Dactylellina haptotyla CBS 200.50]
METDKIVSVSTTTNMNVVSDPFLSTVPFTEADQLVDNFGGFVVGHPLVPLGDEAAVLKFLTRELSTKRLEDMYFIMRFISNRNNINPLHHQALKGRNILLTERPDLHLIWYYDRIYLKPIPLCFFNHLFYQTYILNGTVDGKLHHEASGFLRTYSRLIVHESDFDVAKSKKLLPEHLDWVKWCRFIRGFIDLPDSGVSRRYHYGECRLTRLNFYSKFYNGGDYFETETQYTSYFQKFIGPYLFVFGGISVVLAALQTALTADGESIYKDSIHPIATFSIVTTIAGVTFFPLLYVFYQFKELFFFIFRHQMAT